VGALILWIAWSAGISLVRSPDPVESMQIVGWLAIDALMVLAVLGSGASSERIWAYIVRYGAWAAAIGCGIWVSARVVGTTVGVQTDTTTGAPAVYGLSFEANIFGATMALLVMGVVAMGVPRAARTGRAVYVLPIVGLLVSSTRSAALGLLAGLAAWAVMSGSLRARGRILVGLVVAFLSLALVALIAPSVAEPLVEKAAVAVDFSGGTGAVRAETWSIAVSDLSTTDLLIGKGTNSFGQRHRDQTQPQADRPGYIGNLPLQIVYDSGLVGALLLLVALLSAIPHGRIGRARALAMLIVYLACALATSPFWFASTWLLFAMGLRSRIRERSERAARRPAARARQDSVPAVT
jgi:hypothetical protein